MKMHFQWPWRLFALLLSPINPWNSLPLIQDGNIPWLAASSLLLLVIFFQGEFSEFGCRLNIGIGSFHFSTKWTEWKRYRISIQHGSPIWAIAVGFGNSKFLLQRILFTNFDFACAYLYLHYNGHEMEPEAVDFLSAKYSAWISTHGEIPKSN